jgi:colanic acid/amylovoran biosynthesis protein
MSDSRPTRIVLTSVTGCRNRGVEALVRTTLDRFEQAARDARCTVLTSDHVYDSWLLSERAKVLPDAARLFAGGRATRFAANAAARLRRLPPSIAPSYRAIIDEFRQSDLVVATGGDVFGSDYGSTLPRRSLAMLEAAQDVGARTVFLSHSIGPFKTDEELQAWRGIAERSALITVREQRSFDYVTQEARIAPDRVRLTADPAFLLPVAKRARVDGLWGALGLRADRPTVAIAPSQGIHSFAGLDAAAHVQRWVDVIQLFAERLGAQVLIVPHVQDPNPLNDDRVLASNLLDRARFRPDVRAAFGELRASDFKGLIDRCEMVVGERMHACIAGLSTGTCTVSVGYSVKAAGITAQAMGDDAAERGLTMTGQEFVADGSVLDRLASVWEQRDAVACDLAERLPRIRERAASAFTMALDAS